MKLFCATFNPGKVREFRMAVERFGQGRFQIEPLPGLRDLSPCPENGETFEANAVQKAIYYSAHAPGLLFADDSGLEVGALAGAPGVSSARFAGPCATDAANNRLLLERLLRAEDRAAQFVCVIALAEHGRSLKTFRGVVAGEILHEPRGTQGFGYDPLFFYRPLGWSFGQLSAEQKLQVSHRGRAMAAMLAYVKTYEGAGFTSLG